MSQYEFEGKRPLVASSSFVHPNATIIVDVIIGEKCFISAGTVLRGDYGSIIIGAGSNLQENCVMHAQPDTTAIVGEKVDVGHGAIIHGPCTIGDNVTVGMGSIICDGCEIGSRCFLGAGTLLLPNTLIPPDKLVVGNPARVVKDVSGWHNNYNKLATEIYQDLCERYQNSQKLIPE